MSREPGNGRRAPSHSSRQRGRRLQERVGLPLLPSARPAGATAAGQEHWDRLLTVGERCINHDDLRRLATWIQGMAAQPTGPGAQPAPLAARALELQFAEVLGFEDLGGKAFWDVLRTGEPGIGWEIKLLQNRRANDVAVISSIQGHQVGYKEGTPAKVLAKRLFSYLAESQQEAAEQYGISDSRLAFFYGDRRRSALQFWEEPFYPDPELTESLEWKRRERSIVGRYDGVAVWEWYPHRGQLRYRPEPPAGAPVIAMPTRAIDPLTWQEALRNALIADGLSEELEEAQRYLEAESE